MHGLYAVIVTYNPSNFSGLTELIKSLALANVKCVLVDNSDRVDLERLGGLCTLISNGRNIGIAAAQNIGIKFCIERKADKIIFFDQDSSIEEAYDLTPAEYRQRVAGSSTFEMPA